MVHHTKNISARCVACFRFFLREIKPSLTLTKNDKGKYCWGSIKFDTAERYLQWKTVSYFLLIYITIKIKSEKLKGWMPNRHAFVVLNVLVWRLYRTRLWLSTLANKCPISVKKVNSHEVYLLFQLGTFTYQKLICMEQSTYIFMPYLILSFLFL